MIIKNIILGTLVLNGCIAASTIESKVEAVEVDVYTAAWHIISSSQPAYMGLDSDYYDFKVISTCFDTIDFPCPDGGINSTWNSSWAYVKCMAAYNSELDLNVYGFMFKADYGSWPSSYPSEVVCYKEGSGDWAGDSVEVIVPLDNMIDSTSPGIGEAITQLNLTNGVSITINTYNGYSEGSDISDKTLPSGTYISGTVQCKKANGTNWLGATAIVVENTTSVDRVRFIAASDAAKVTNGYCPISKNGSIVNVPYSIY